MAERPSDEVEEFDPIDWLRSLDPLEKTLAGGTLMSQDEILRRVLAGARSRRRNRRLIPVAVAAAVVVGAGSVAAALLARQPGNPITVGCYAEVDLGGSLAVVSSRGDPLEACAQAWEDDDLHDVFGGGPPPPLAPCRLPSGDTAVFPAAQGDPCAALGLDAGGEPHPDDAAVLALDAAARALLDDGCVPVADAVDAMRRVLDDLDLDHWTVEINDEYDFEPSCSSIAIEPADTTVYIVPIPPE